MRLLTLALLLPSAALAQNYDGHGFTYIPEDADLADLITTWRPETQRQGAVGVSGLFEYADNPLILETEQPDGSFAESRLLDSVFGLNLGVHVGAHERVAVALGMPLFFASSGPDGGNGVSAGDLNLAVPIGLLLRDEQGQGFGMSVVPFIDLPSGAGARFLGDQGVGAGILVPVGFRSGAIEATGNLGVSVPGSNAFENLTNAPRLHLGVGLSYDITETFGVRGEASFKPALSANTFKGTESPGETTISVKHKPIDHFNWTAGGAFAFTRGATAATYRIFAGAGYAFGKDAPPPAIPANVDVIAHTDENERIEAAKVSDGTAATPTNANGTVRMEGLEAFTPLTLSVSPPQDLPVESVQVPTFELVEGDQTVDVLLPWKPGAMMIEASADGKPIDASVSMAGPSEETPFTLGSDGQAYTVLPAGDWTVFVEAAGLSTERVELTVPPGAAALLRLSFDLKPAVLEVTKDEVILLEQVQFAFDDDKVLDASLPLLQQVTTAMMAAPEIKVVEIQGHTDWIGTPEYNADLSQRRMDAVLAYLIEQGLSPDRIVPVGYGEACPLTDNSTEEGRAENRRVQFIVLDPAPADGIPCHDGNPARRATSRTLQRTEPVEP